MKNKRLNTLLACSFLVLVGGSSLLSINLASQGNVEKVSATDVGNVTFTGVNTGISSGNSFYLTAEDNVIPTGWAVWEGGDGATPLHPVDTSTDGVFINGVSAGQTITKKADGYFWFNLNTTLTLDDIGTVVTIKGNWTGYTADSYGHEEWSFTAVEYSMTWDGASWTTYNFCDYDLISLKDCGIRDYTNEVINTEDGAVYSAGRSLAKANNEFGLVNDSESFVFRFNCFASSREGDISVRIGSNSAWDAGHFLKLYIPVTWGPTGVAYVNEQSGGTILDNHTMNGNVDLQSATRLIDFGAIKIEGTETNKHFVFLNCGGTRILSAYWDLDSALRTHRVGFYAGTTNFSISNAVDPVEQNENITLRVKMIQPGKPYMIYFNVDKPELVKSPVNWNDWFISADGLGLTYNGTTLSDNGNNIKHTGSSELFIDVGAMGATTTPAEGDRLVIKGLFKLAYLADDSVTPNIWLLTKIVIKEEAYVFNGTTWVDEQKTYVQGFVTTYMHMDYTENLDYCKDSTHHYYLTAKGGYNSIIKDNDDREYYWFNDSEFAAAKLRYETWAVKNNDGAPYDGNATVVTLARSLGISFGFSDVANDPSALILIISLASITALGVFFFIRKKKKKF